MQMLLRSFSKTGHYLGAVRSVVALSMRARILGLFKPVLIKQNYLYMTTQNMYIYTRNFIALIRFLNKLVTKIRDLNRGKEENNF